MDIQTTSEVAERLKEMKKLLEVAGRMLYSAEANRANKVAGWEFHSKRDLQDGIFLKSEAMKVLLQLEQRVERAIERERRDRNDAMSRVHDIPN